MKIEITRAVSSEQQMKDIMKRLTLFGIDFSDEIEVRFTNVNFKVSKPVTIDDIQQDLMDPQQSKDELS